MAADVSASRADRARRLVVERLADEDREAWRVTDPATGSVHIVERGPGGELGCDSRCRGYEHRGRCSHVDAVSRFENGGPPDDSERLTDPAPDDANTGPGLVDRDIPPDEGDAPRLELVRDAPGGADPVLAAIARAGVDALVDGHDDDVRGVLYRLAQESAKLTPIDRALLHAEATQRFTAGGIDGASEMVGAAVQVGRHMSEAAGREDPSPPPPPATAGREAPALLLRSLGQLLEDPDSLKPPTAVIPRLAFGGRVTLLAAREKAGKSTLLAAGAAAVTRGADFLGEPCVSGSVLWVSADQEHGGEIAQRAQRFGTDPARLHVLWPREPFADLAAAVDRVAPVFVLIDTLATFARVEDPHSAAEWPGKLLPLVRLARERNLALALLHHSTKGENPTYRDSTAIGGAVDLIVEMQRDGDGPRRKVSALGRWPVSGFTLELVGDCYRVLAGGELSLDAQVLAFIGANPRSSLRALRAGVGGRADDVDQALGRLLASQAVQNAGTDTRHAYVAVSAASGGASEDPDAPPF